ncbi:hypothetical protein TRFO_06000 [Tritrichomonas foetus]|uniref:PSP1 C-terminal domain-containing protein n=1 Tax=Tritrichomonas foetus TaxID=1144522 RepID=A0A1J4K7K3_9EUKA|nr:hypothetical protein TRFO_06000 [Tritrichomonas foetus]|eukprot:OHT05397.1 hypothetical protein TRFO_06000 [Tritrichomonas foetus]
MQSWNSYTDDFEGPDPSLQSLLPSSLKDVWEDPIDIPRPSSPQDIHVMFPDGRTSRGAASPSINYPGSAPTASMFLSREIHTAPSSPQRLNISGMSDLSPFTNTSNMSALSNYNSLVNYSNLTGPNSFNSGSGLSNISNFDDLGDINQINSITNLNTNLNNNKNINNLSSSGKISPSNREYCSVQFHPNRIQVLQYPQSMNLIPGDYVITDADRGIDIGVVTEINEQPSPKDAKMAKVVVRKAANHELQQIPMKEEKERNALALCQAKVQELGLPMQITGAEYQFDGKKLTFYYAASNYVDFRNLVRVLFRIFGTRIWMIWYDGTAPVKDVLTRTEQRSSQ